MMNGSLENHNSNRPDDATVLALREIVRRHGTPTYAFDMRRLRTQVEKLRSHLPPGAEILYSLKSNASLGICDVFADCGIGAAIFPTVGWAAATSNVIWDVGTTAVMSAISSPETCSAKKVETARLILETLPGLERDIAVGSGDYLAALNEVMDCVPSARADLAARLRLSYGEVVGRESYGQKSRIERAADLFGSVRDVTSASPGSCNVAL